MDAEILVRALLQHLVHERRQLGLMPSPFFGRIEEHERRGNSGMSDNRLWVVDKRDDGLEYGRTGRAKQRLRRVLVEAMPESGRQLFVTDVVRNKTQPVDQHCSQRSKLPILANDV